eukprot:TRINITY_DN1904_c0_g2_i1.p1 TRINITY_DN1904_c0_g2~~TRINITY_DN1904_c0_g2_i1.p1  ORF type:complete len:322 (+),score=116.83 TRINITY_DN1904_c0_g2_i1:54-1019(+)
MGTAAAELLVLNRFPEFQKKAQSKGLLGGASGTKGLEGGAISSNPFSTAAPAGNGENSSFMREFFTGVRELQSALEEGHNNVKAMAALLEDALQATTQEREEQIAQQLQSKVEETMEHIAEIKTGLEMLKARSDEVAAKDPHSAQNKIRTNMQQAMAKKHQTLLLDFQKAQQEYKRALEKRQQRELEILMPEATAEERQDLLEQGQTAALMVAQKMAGTHALLLDEVQRIQEKHQDILRLERSMNDLASMFQEIAVLVDAQGEMLDAIEVHVNKTAGYTAKAEKELIKTRKAQHSGRKWMCCLTILLLVILLVILGPILIK